MEIIIATIITTKTTININKQLNSHAHKQATKNYHNQENNSN